MDAIDQLRERLNEIEAIGMIDEQTRMLREAQLDDIEDTVDIPEEEL